MKVLLTTDTVGGVWNFSLSLARALPFEVHLATMGRRLSPPQRLEIADFAFHESEFPLEWMPNPWAGVDRAGEWLLGIEQQIQPDIIHHNTLALGHLPFRNPAIVTVHSCVLSWWEAVKNATAPSEWDQYRERVTCSLRAAAEVTVPSFALSRSTKCLYGVDSRVVPNFAAKPLSLSTKEPFVFAAGRVWDEAKNLLSLQRVAPSLSWPVHIAGEGSDLGHLDSAAIGNWMARASIYAWPGKYEPFGLSVLEAAQHGCALVLGDIESLRENWDGAALFVRDDEELESALRLLISESGLRSQYSAKAMERSGRFQESITVNGYSAAYERVLSGALCAS